MKGIADLEYQGLLRSVGTHRNTRPLSPVEVAELLGKAVAAGATRSECAQALGIGPKPSFCLSQPAPTRSPNTALSRLAREQSRFDRILYYGGTKAPTAR